MEKIDKTKSILNLGCGNDKEGLGIDINPDFNPDIVADICKPLGIGRYDIVKAIEVMEHVREPRSLIENMIKHMKPDGMGIIATPSALGYEISYRFRGKKKINSSVSQYLTPCVIKGLINRCGGRIIYQNLGSRWWLKHIVIKFKINDTNMCKDCGSVHICSGAKVYCKSCGKRVFNYSGFAKNECPFCKGEIV